jgi:CubicO group peptidase (beta-lactamase class C family)
VTVRRLLSHTAGLGVVFVPGYEGEAPLPSLVKILDGLPPANTQPVRVETRPGAEFRYWGGGYVLLQLLLEDVTGKPFDELAAELVLGPLGMDDSTFARRPGDGHRYPEQAAAGLWTTPSDLARFVLALQEGAAGSEPMLELQAGLPAEGEWTVLRSLGVEPPTSMGLGLFLSSRGWFSHLGGSFGFFSAIVGSLSGGKGAALMTDGNATPAFFETLLAIGSEFGWEGFRCR